MSTEFGTPFWRTMKSALVAAGWNLDVVSDVLRRDDGYEVRRDSETSASLRGPDIAGQEIVRSRRQAPDARALEIAGKIHERVARRTYVAEAP